MDLTKIYTDSDFANAVVPEGKILTFTGTDENGIPVTRYKNSSGNFGILSGSCGSGGGTDTNAMDFYRCTAVFGPKTVTFLDVAGAGVEDCNGRYEEGEEGVNGKPLYSYTSSSGTTWYIYYMPSEYEGNYWVLSNSTTTPYPYSAHYYASELTGSWWGGENGSDPTPTITPGSKEVNVDDQRLWDGYKVDKTADGYIVQDTVVTGLSYTEDNTPEVYGVYNSDATIHVTSLHPLNFIKKPLTLTALTMGSTVTFNVSDTTVSGGLMYSRTGLSWNKYQPGTKIELDKAGDSVYFWNTRNQFKTSGDGKFVLTGEIEASGDLMSLLNYSDTCTPYCFYGLFQDCASLIRAPEISATTVASNCYNRTFYGCSNLLYLPTTLPAVTLADSCYKEMFHFCYKAIQAPEILASGEFPNDCCYYMFRRCEAMTKAPTFLNASSCGDQAFYQMFEDCKSLTKSPRIGNVISSTGNSFYGMFYNCSLLSEIEVDFTTWPRSDYWCSYVASEGTFIKPEALEEIRGTGNIPEGWTIVNK